mmetsp:Transcript_88888/g.198758  ORF Transcript_88888/g.198758 Transcript_88888/m.198758 type:complete len:244 (+) Transcript_88888:726-1457(+)
MPDDLLDLHLRHLHDLLDPSNLRHLHDLLDRLDLRNDHLLDDLLDLRHHHVLDHLLHLDLRDLDDLLLDLDHRHLDDLLHCLIGDLRHLPCHFPHLHRLLHVGRRRIAVDRRRHDRSGRQLDGRRLYGGNLESLADRRHRCGVDRRRRDGGDWQLDGRRLYGGGRRRRGVDSRCRDSGDRQLDRCHRLDGIELGTRDDAVMVGVDGVEGCGSRRNHGGRRCGVHSGCHDGCRRQLVGAHLRCR